MQTADLYIRVSTEDQKDKGYSQRYQEEVLRRYCEFHNIMVRYVYVEDHSAKTFKRPKFTQALVVFHKQKSGANLLLFTKWDRFSRNTVDAYNMLKTLSKLGVSAQAIEQPLDLTIPENKMMLAVYLAQPEVENDRRSLNVHGGMRRAKKEGRWMGTAPIGYRNIHTPDGKKKYIEPDPVQAPIVKWIFEQIADGTFTAASIYREAVEKGLKAHKGKCCSRNNFWNAIRNPVYCGKIKVDAYKAEEAGLVAGQHAPLISERLFYQVQEVLDGKKRKPVVSKSCDDRFPLRGFLQCTDRDCGRILTASSSRGKLGVYYDYYHCTGKCKVRHAAGKIHESFEMELSKWKPHPAVKTLYALVLDDLNSQGTKSINKELMAIQDEIATIQDQLRQNRKFLLQEKIDADDYRAEKKECETRLFKLESQMNDLIVLKPDIKPMFDDAIGLLENIDHAYKHGTLEFKREFLGSMFPGKLQFDGLKVRTQKVNEVGRLIYSMGAAFSEVKMGQIKQIADLSHEVIPLVQISNSFLYDLQKLSRLYQSIKAA